MLDIEKIRARREKLGLTQEEAARRAGFSGRQQWNNIETGAAGGKDGITLGTLDKIAAALECKAKDLLK